MNNPYAQQASLAKSREDVVVEYAPFVRQIANRLAARLPEHLDRNDLIQAGMIGLLDALEKYDGTRETQFRTYAEFRIRGAMLDDMRASDWVPRSVRDNADRIGSATQQLTARLGRQPNEAELAEHLKMSLVEYQELLLKSRAINLLGIEDMGARGDDGQRADMFEVLEDPFCTNPLEALSLGDLKARLKSALDELPEKEKLVLSLYYDEDLNLKEIGAVLGITESRVSQIRTQAIIRLRQSLKAIASPELLEAFLENRAQ